MTQLASSQHFRRDPTCQTCSKQVTDIDSANPPALQGGCCYSFPVEGDTQGGRRLQDTQPARGLWTEQLRGLGGRSRVSMWGREGGVGTGASCRARACLGAWTWGRHMLPGEGLGPCGPSPETLRESDSQGKSQGFRMLRVDSLFPKNTGGMN